MAIRVLLDHGVPQENVIFVTFVVSACGGVRVLQRAFPRVRIVCGAVDPVLRESWALWDTDTAGTGREGGGEGEGRGTPTAKTRKEAEEARHLLRATRQERERIEAEIAQLEHAIGDGRIAEVPAELARTLEERFRRIQHRDGTGAQYPRYRT